MLTEAELFNYKEQNDIVDVINTKHNNGTMWVRNEQDAGKICFCAREQFAFYMVGFNSVCVY